MGNKKKQKKIQKRLSLRETKKKELPCLPLGDKKKTLTHLPMGDIVAK